MKFAICSMLVALALVQLVCAQDEFQQHNFEWGKKGPNDKLVWSTNHYGRPGGYGAPASQRVFYSDWNYGPDITYISVTDHFTDGTGGYARILYGGIGDREVMIELRSQKTTPFNFTVEIYG